MSYDIERGRPYQGNSGFAGKASYGGEDPLVTSLTENIRQISNNCTNLQKLLSTLGTNKDGPEVREKLNNTVETTKGIIRNATQQIKDLGNNARGAADERNQKLTQQKLTKDFGVWVQKFQEISKMAVQKERSTPLPAATPVYNGLQPQKAGAPFQTWGKQPQPQPQPEQYHQYVDPDIDEKQGLLESTRRDNLMQIENEREFNDAMIQDREEGIKQIEAAITEVGMIFSDLAQIVQDQGVMIDNIESNVESTESHTAAAVVEIRQASKYQKKARTKMCILILIIVIVLAAISVAIYFGVKL